MSWRHRTLLFLALAPGFFGCRSAPANPERPREISPTAGSGIEGDAALQVSLQAALTAKGADYQPRTRHKRADGQPKYANRLILETSPYLLADVLRRRFVPNHVWVLARADTSAIERLVPWVKGKTALRNTPTAYVCERGSCQLPTSDPQTFARQLQSHRSLAPRGR